MSRFLLIPRERNAVRARARRLAISYHKRSSVTYEVRRSFTGDTSLILFTRKFRRVQQEWKVQ